MTDRLAFFTDVPDLRTFDWPADTIDAVPAEASPPTSRIQLFKTGRFRHPRYGRSVITRDTFDSFVRNFHAVSGGEVAMDFDHAADYMGDTRACGWIKALHPEGDELWATVEWTWQGAWAIKDREYRYISPTFTLNYVSDDETKRGPVIVGAALTNRAFLERMAPVCLSRTAPPDGLELAVEDDEGSPDSRPRPMSDYSNIAPLLKLSADADEAQITAAITTLVAQAQNTVPDGHVTVAASRLTDLEAKQQVPAGHSVIANSRLETLEQREGEADRLSKELGELRFESAFKQAMDEGRVTPAQKPNLLAIFEKDAKLGLDTLAAMLPQVVTAARGTRGDTGPAEGPDGYDAESYDLDRKVQAYRREHPDLSYTDALDRVLEQQEAMR